MQGLFPARPNGKTLLLRMQLEGSRITVMLTLGQQVAEVQRMVPKRDLRIAAIEKC